jgi:16S rRNA (adenine1518-N6/adenine1519-N6)-dimethyltransferase
VKDTETILEIGPGQGALTRWLCQVAKRVIAVELDPVMAATLPTRFQTDRLVVVEQDILRTDFQELGREYGIDRWHIVGNLPYVIGSRLLMNLVQQSRAVERATVMLQLEVAERILAPPGSRMYGLLSVLLQATGTLTREFRVGPGAFRPMPTVQSLVFSWDSCPPPDLDIPALIVTVKAAFNQRRKRLDNALKLLGTSREIIAEACARAEIDPGARAEHVAPHEFVRLSHAFKELGASLARVR